MRRTVSALLLVSLSGCQCFQPVAELGVGPDASVTPDAGRDGGAPDAGRPDAGARDAGPECRLASDCAWAPPLDAGFGSPIGWTWDMLFPCPSSQGMSCIAGLCLFECNSGRACDPDGASHCLTCTAPTSSTTCGPTLCASRYTCRMGVVSSTCATGPVTGAQYDLAKQNDCSFRVTLPDGGPVVGAVWELDPAQSFGTFPGVDGVCVGRDLFTGAPRMQWSCPGGCVFVEMGCD